MASLAPALCNPCAIDHAMLRLLATPKTTATRPSRLEDMLAPFLILNITTETQSHREKLLGIFLMNQILFYGRDFVNGHWRRHWPNCADESHGVDHADNG